MSTTELVRWLIDGGVRNLLVLASLPVVIGLSSAALARAGHRSGSQALANAGIALGLLVALVTSCALSWSLRHGGSPLAEVGIGWLVLPLWMIAAAWWIEHRLHPGRQAAIRGRIRGGLLWVIALAVVYWLLSGMRVWMLVHTGVLGLLFFLAVLIGFFWLLARRATAG